MRVSATRSRRSPGWRRPLRSVETESSGSTWMCYWNRFAPIRASTSWYAVSVYPRSSRSSIARSAMRAHRARQGMTILMILFVLGLTVPSRAQVGNEGSIEGIVTDPSGAVIPGVMLCVKNPNTSDTFNTTTNELGLFRFPVLPVGSYELVAEHPGFASLIQKNVVVNIGAEVNLTLILRLAVGTETVVVRDETPLLESTRSQMSSTVDARLVSSLPLNGRTFLGFVFLTPGVTPGVTPAARGVSLSFGGQRGMYSLLLDGADNSNTFFGGSP